MYVLQTNILGQMHFLNALSVAAALLLQHNVLFSKEALRLFCNIEHHHCFWETKCKTEGAG